MSLYRRFGLTVVLTLCVCLGGSRALAECEVAKLTAIDAAVDDWLGKAVSLSGSYAAVGAYYDDDLGADSGSVYIFRRSEDLWPEVGKLVPNDGAPFDYFGISVAIDGDYVVVGAPYDDDAGTQSGAAYVFSHDGSTWIQEAKLTASDARPGEKLGFSVGISGPHVMVGAPHTYSDPGPGSAYIFRRDGTAWIEEAKLNASDGSTGDRFGIGVSIDGDYAIVGADYDDDSGQDSGAAYAFRRDDSGAWVEEAKLTAIDAAGGDRFGRGVSISGDRAVSGARYGHDNGSQSGAAYVFIREDGTWIEEAKLTPRGGATYFGGSVSIRGDYLAIGAWGSGRAYIFERTEPGWVQQAELTASDGGFRSFGYSVALGEGFALVGDWKDDNQRGAGYVYQFLSGPAPDCNENGFRDECELFGDFVDDGDIALDDFAAFSSFLGGPGAGSDCAVFDSNLDGRIDLRDFAAFQGGFTGH